MRARAWPLLLGVDTQLGPEEEQEYLELRCAKHRDSAVVECDVQRSLWTFTEGAPPDTLMQHRLCCGCLPGVLSPARSEHSQLKFRQAP